MQDSFHPLYVWCILMPRIQVKWPRLGLESVHPRVAPWDFRPPGPGCSWYQCYRMKNSPFQGWVVKSCAKIATKVAHWPYLNVTLLPSNFKRLSDCAHIPLRPLASGASTGESGQMGWAWRKKPTWLLWTDLLPPLVYEWTDGADGATTVASIFHSRSENISQITVAACKTSFPTWKSTLCTCSPL